MYQPVYYFLVMACFSVFMGCGNTGSGSKPSAPENTAKAADPVASFRQFIVSEIAKLKEAMGSTASVNDDYKIDVKKTESLVSPLIGQLLVDVSITQVMPDKSMYIDQLEVEVTYGEQSGNWSMTSGSVTRKGYEVISDWPSKNMAQVIGKFVGRSYAFENFGDIKSRYETIRDNYYSNFGGPRK